MEIVITERRNAVTLNEGVVTVVSQPVTRVIEKQQSVTARNAYVNLERDYVCSGTVSALKAVSVTANGEIAVADPSNVEVLHVVGIAITAGNIGEAVRVQYGGAVYDNSWNWTIGGSVFVGANGMLTQTAISTGVLHYVGVATDAKTIQLHIPQSTILN